MKKIVFILCSLFIATSIQSQSYLIKFNFKKGAEFKQNLNSSMQITQEVSGQEMQINMGIKATTTFKVTKAKDTTYEMDVKYSNMSMSMQMAGQPTSSAVDDMVGKMLRQIEGKSFQISLSSSGNIISVRNLEQLFNQLFDSLPSLSQEQKEQFKIQISQAYGEASFKSSFKVSTSVFPSYAVQKGDQWAMNSQLISNYTFDVNSQFQLVDVDKEFYYIKAKSKLSTLNQSDSSYSEVNGMSIRVMLNGAAESTYKLDRKTAWIIESTTQQTLQGSTEIKETEQFKGGMKIPLKMTQTSTIKS
jgi:hypothetical protein